MRKKIPPFDINNRSFYWLGHTVPYEMTFSIKITGQLKTAQLKDAIKKVIFDTPLLQTKIKNFLFFIRRTQITLDKNFDINTIFAFDDAFDLDNTFLDSSQDERITAYYNNHINIKTQLPIHFYLCMGKKNDYLFLVKVSHTLADAQAIYIIIAKIFQAYNTLLGTSNKVALPGEPESYSLKQLEKHIKESRATKTGAEDQAEHISFFKDNNNAQGNIKSIPHLVHKNDYKQLHAMAKTNNFSFNDFLVSLITMTTYKILEKRTIPVETIRIEQLVDLRKPLGMEGALANIISIFYIDIEKTKFANNAALLQSVKEKTKHTLETKQYLQTLAHILPLKKIPSRIITKLLAKDEKKNCQEGKAFFSASISNTGQLKNIIEVPYNCTIDYILSSVTPHPTIGIKWVITTFDQDMTINLVYLDPIITDTTARHAMHIFKEEFQVFLNNQNWKA